MSIKVPLNWRSLIVPLVILVLVLYSSAPVLAQNAGNKGVWNINNILSPSTVWIDASAWWSNNSTQPDLCLYLQQRILTGNYNSAYPNGAVIDARGLAFGVQQGNQIACSVDPFGALTGPPPSTVLLLPSGNIIATQTWIIPNNTRIIGDEQQTAILGECGSCSYVIEMGGINTINNQQKPLCPSTGCTSVGIEHLSIGAGGNTNVGGIQNQYAQTGSYVKDVTLNGFSQIGLSVAGPYTNSPYPGATNSGPYSDIVFNSGSTGTPTCIDLEAQTQGVHGLTCIGNANTYTQTSGGVGISVKASNNTIEDVHIESFWDGIQVGPGCPTLVPSCTVANVLISNVTGMTTGNSGGVTQNTVHICGTKTFNANSFGMCGTSGAATVEDITVLHVLNDNSNPGQTTIVDDTSQNGIVSCYTSAPVAGPGCAAPLSTGMYILGEPYAQSTNNPSYSAFTSSPTTPNGNYRGASSYMPTWGVGATSPPIQPNNYCSPAGAIYSWTGALANTSSVYVCKPTVGTNYGRWTAIP